MSKSEKPSRENLPEGKSLCDYCKGKCCRYFALGIDEPVDWEDFDRIRWFLLHDKAAVFTEDEDWYLLVRTKCKNLDKNNRCKDYDNRPNVCRQYSSSACEYKDNWVYDRYFETPEQVAEYAEAVLGPRFGDDIRSPENPAGFSLQGGDDSF
ncbi:MAG: YkgJ family cysteine cluster protein [Planctomycetia bacterium]|nr:YkgJ family cysteine cluster protein [Planctomycetia bacterium]